MDTPEKEMTDAEEAEELEECVEHTKPEPAPKSAAEVKVKDLKDDLVRLQAEFENYKKRVERESAQRSRLGEEMVVADLLPLLDAFDKALEDANGNGDAVSLKKGLNSLHRQLFQILKGHGLREVRTDGRLDPFEHEAMMRQEAADAEDGRILEVFQKGYAMGPKVLRTAKVKVAKAPDQDVTTHDTQDTQEDVEEEDREED